MPGKELVMDFRIFDGIAAEDIEVVLELSQESFVESDFSIRDLMVEIATTQALHDLP